jgi:multiple sugar transport system ATP-binding protein
MSHPGPTEPTEPTEPTGPTGPTGLRGVTVRFGGTVALRDVTLLAAPGELLVVLGASGSGKSTLLRAVAGLLPVASGTVLVDGRDVTGTSPQERRLAMVFEAGALVPFLDVAANLGWGLRTRGVPEPEASRRVGLRAGQFRLTRLLRRRPAQLSEGERGLVGIGRALVQQPRAFLLDEPLAHLDAAERLRVRRRIVEVVRPLGVAVLYVTHDPTEALAVADRVALLHEGRIEQLGPPAELYERPVSLLAAGSTGFPPIGLVPARLVSAEGMAGFEVGPRTLPLWGPAPVPPGEVVLGFRPEDVHLSARPDAVALDVVVTAVEYTGRHQALTLAVGAGPVTAPGADLVAAGGATLRALVPPHDPVRPGDATTVWLDARRAHLFDPVTGAALHHP